MAETNLALFPDMRVIPSVEIEADAVLRLTLLPQSAAHFHQRGRGGRERVREGRRVGGRDGGREGGRKGGRGVLSQWKEGASICISTIRLQIGHLFDEYMHYLHCALTSKHCTCIPFYIYIKHVKSRLCTSYL